MFRSSNRNCNYSLFREVDNFTQKINSYFENIDKPVLVVINSFEEVLKENKQEIIDFILHLASFPNIKTILISRTFAYSDFDKGIAYKRATILALEKSVFEKFLRSEGIKNIGPFSDELYKHSRGYFFYTLLSIKIMHLRKLSILEFIEKYNGGNFTVEDIWGNLTEVLIDVTLVDEMSPKITMEYLYNRLCAIPLCGRTMSKPLCFHLYISYTL